MIFLLFLTAAVVLVGCGEKTPRIRSAVIVASEVGEDGKADAVESYPADREELLLYGKALNFGAADGLTIRWIYEQDGEYLIHEDTGNRGYVYEFYSRITNGGYPWPAGAYRVEIYINDADTPDATVRFSVE